MNRSFEEQVRERAYHLWESAGMAHGMAHEHWIHAERALMTEHAPSDIKRSASSKPSKSTTKPVAVAAAKKTKVAKASSAKSPAAKVASATKKAPTATARAFDMMN